MLEQQAGISFGIAGKIPMSGGAIVVCIEAAAVKSVDIFRDVLQIFGSRATEAVKVDGWLEIHDFARV